MVPIQGVVSRPGRQRMVWNGKGRGERDRTFEVQKLMLTKNGVSGALENRRNRDIGVVVGLYGSVSERRKEGGMIGFKMEFVFASGDGVVFCFATGSLYAGYIREGFAGTFSEQRASPLSHHPTKADLILVNNAETPKNTQEPETPGKHVEESARYEARIQTGGVSGEKIEQGKMSEEGKARGGSAGRLIVDACQHRHIRQWLCFHLDDFHLVNGLCNSFLGFCPFQVPSNKSIPCPPPRLKFRRNSRPFPTRRIALVTVLSSALDLSWGDARDGPPPNSLDPTPKEDDAKTILVP
ncbi:hypothetical protein B0H16DRAFT_1481999 [Mycena metata]|uniref:Uncharacterized protein n=1 Tax=Mycena metata TaxID=1033252 RepID=A0AAD7GW18_9AGAR|nr:hypothetical protein B0H16DRAFT_1481999 [Mycena metata]